jgi:tRNA(fMet)-specific endonuclease VapC
MLQYLFDTDHLTLYDHSDVMVWRRFSAHPWLAVGVSSTTVEEYLRGRLAVLARHQKGVPYVTAHARFVASLQLLQQFPIISFDLPCEASYQRLRALRLGVGSQDLRIASAVLVHQLTLVTRNQRDFGRIPGLRTEDWSV